MEEKNSSFDSSIERTAEKLKICGHPLRLRILCMIDRQDACVSDLWQCLNQTQPVISQHLAVLKDKGLVKAEILGNRRIYSVIDPFVRRILATVNEEEET